MTLRTSLVYASDDDDDDDDDLSAVYLTDVN